jgi:hypothetical protein
MEWMTTTAGIGMAAGANARGRHLHGLGHAGLMLTLLVFVFSGISHGQSLGDAAREARAKSQQSGTAPAKVITNDDLVEKEAAQPEEEAAKEPQQNSSTSTQPDVKSKSPATTDQAQNAVGQKQAPETPAQPDPDAIAKDIKTRAATLRSQIAAVQSQISKLQRGYINRWALPDSIPETEYALREQRAIAFNQQVTELIATQKKLLADLKAQMESLKEEARHAGVKLPAK